MKSYNREVFFKDLDDLICEAHWKHSLNKSLWPFQSSTPLWPTAPQGRPHSPPALTTWCDNNIPPTETEIECIQWRDLLTYIDNDQLKDCNWWLVHTYLQFLLIILSLQSRPTFRLQCQKFLTPFHYKALAMEMVKMITGLVSHILHVGSICPFSCHQWDIHPPDGRLIHYEKVGLITDILNQWW